MNRFADLTEEQRGFYFQQASDRLGLPPAAIEKDFWVCWMLARLFSSERLAPKILFKGGTSLSKVFGLIRRFSEDIDLILDWNEVVPEDPNLTRSKTRQDGFNQSVNELSRCYIRETFLPEVQQLVASICSAEVEEGSPDVINIRYPSIFTDRYLRPEIRLEIGPLAQWIPNARYEVRPYAAEVFPDLFTEPVCYVQAIKAERTFWEKVTILHCEAFRPETKPLPSRYSRHYYDLVMMADDQAVRNAALGDLELLHSVVEFKKKFYPRAWAHYELSKPGTLKLLPPEHHRKTLAADYRQMQVMLFGDVLPFDELMEKLQNLETAINQLT
jgi:hypothetical protein